MDTYDENGHSYVESDEDSQVFFSDPHYIHYAGMLRPLRPGVDDCFQMLEFTHYLPGTPRNDLFHLRVFNWMDIIWGIASIPVAEKGFMESIARVNRLRIVHGSPILFDGDGRHLFPVVSLNLHTFENISGHPVYGNAH